MNPNITVATLKTWLANLPKEFDDVGIESIVFNHPSTAKRIVAYKAIDGSAGVCVSSMGTHGGFDNVEIVAVLQ